MKANVTNKQTPRWHYIKINQRYHLVFSAHLATEPSPVVRLLLHQLSVAFCRHLVVVVVLILLVVDGFYVVVIILVVLDNGVFVRMVVVFFFFGGEGRGEGWFI